MDEFVELTQSILVVRDEMEELEEKYMFVFEMYSMMQDYSIEISDEDQTTKVLVTQSLNSLKSNLTLSEDKITEQTHKFTKVRGFFLDSLEMGDR